MKLTHKLLVAVLLFTANSALAQDVELSAYTGWMFGGVSKYSYNLGSSELKNVSGQNYGGTFSVRMPSFVILEVGYMRMDSELKFRGYLGETNQTIDMSTEYYQIGAVKEIVPDGDLRPFGLISIGAVRYHPKEGFYSDEWLFAANLGLGAKYYISDRFGLRLQARMMMPFSWVSGGVYCGTGGCGSGVSASSTVIEGDISGGILVVLK